MTPPHAAAFLYHRSISPPYMCRNFAQCKDLKKNSNLKKKMTDAGKGTDSRKHFFFPLSLSKFTYLNLTILTTAMDTETVVNEEYKVRCII